MISNLKCQICLQSFGDKSSPRVCNKCGNSICQKCLTGIYVKQGGYICPYCKNKAQQIWAKNISILNMMDEEKCINLCQTHKRKAVSFCSSPVCNLPIAICDLAECSKIHKQRGTNNIPMSLILQSPDSQLNRQVMTQVIQNFYQTVQQTILKQICQMKANALKSINQNVSEKSMFKSESQTIVDNIKKNNLEGITSEMLSKIKIQLLEEQQNEEVNLKAKNIELVENEKKMLDQQLSKTIKQTQVNFMSTFQLIRRSSNRNQKPQIIEEEKLASKKITIFQQNESGIRNIDDPIQKFLMAPKSSPQYNLVYEVIGKHFKPTLIFSGNKSPSTSFKNSIATRSNLFFRIQLGDAKVIGCFFKRPYINKFNTEVFVVDPDAFVYWLNTSRVYKASKNSVSQYDVSPDYLFSCGNTYKWDGFWFPKNFNKINPDSNKAQIKSQQYVDLVIPIPNRNVVNFDVFELKFTD